MDIDIAFLAESASYCHDGGSDFRDQVRILRLRDWLAEGVWNSGYWRIGWFTAWRDRQERDTGRG